MKIDFLNFFYNYAGLEPGSVVITEEAVDGLLRPYMEVVRVVHLSIQQGPFHHPFLWLELSFFFFIHLFQLNYLHFMSKM